MEFQILILKNTGKCWNRKENWKLETGMRKSKKKGDGTSSSMTHAAGQLYLWRIYEVSGRCETIKLNFKERLELLVDDNQSNFRG